MPRYDFLRPPAPPDLTPLYQQGIAAAGAAEEARGAGLDVLNRFLAQKLAARQRREEAATEFDYRRQLYGMQAREARELEDVRMRHDLFKIRARAAAERDEELQSAARYAAAAREARGVLGNDAAFTTWKGRLAEADPALKGLVEGLDDKAAKTRLEQFFLANGPPDRAKELADVYGKRTERRYISPEAWGELQERFTARYGEEGREALEEVLGAQPRSLEDVYARYQKGDVLSSVRALAPPTTRQETVEGGVKVKTPSAYADSIGMAREGVPIQGRITWDSIMRATRDPNAVFGDQTRMAAAMLESHPLTFTTQIDEQGVPHFKVQAAPGAGGGEITRRLQAYLDTEPGRIAFAGYLAAQEGGAAMTMDEFRAIGRAVTGVREEAPPQTEAEAAPSLPDALRKQQELIRRARGYLGEDR